MPERITNEVLAERLENLINSNKTEHASILEQTTKTNGKVAAVSKIQERMIGALIILNIFLVPIIVAVVIKFVIDNLF